MDKSPSQSPYKPPKKKMKFKTVIQGSKVQEFIDTLKKDSPTDDDIDNLVPFYFDAVMEDDIRIMFKVEMLSEKEYKDFLKSFSMIKGNIESVLNKAQDFIAQNKEKANNKDETVNKKVGDNINKLVYGLLKDNNYFQDSFYTVLSRFTQCLNPEIFLSDSVTSILEYKYKAEISSNQFYDLFMELYNESHPSIEYFIGDVPLIKKDGETLKAEYEELIKDLTEKRLNNTITHEEYINNITNMEKEISLYNNYNSYIETVITPELKKMPMSMIQDIIEDLLNLKVSNFFKNVSLDKLLPVFYKILDYNEYKVKKKLLQIGGQIRSLTDQQSGTIYSSGKSLITVRNGENQLPELSYSVQ